MLEAAIIILAIACFVIMDRYVIGCDKV